MSGYAAVKPETGAIEFVCEYSGRKQDPSIPGYTVVHTEEAVDPSEVYYDFSSAEFLPKTDVPHSIEGTSVYVNEGVYFVLEDPSRKSCVDGTVDSSGVIDVDVDEPGVYYLTLHLDPHRPTEIQVYVG